MIPHHITNVAAPAAVPAHGEPIADATDYTVPNWLRRDAIAPKGSPNWRAARRRRWRRLALIALGLAATLRLIVWALM